MFENGSFHTRECYDKCYTLRDISAHDVNDCCSKLAYSTQLSKIISRSIDPPEQINYIYLSYDQLVSKLHEKDNKIKQLT